MEKPMEKQIQEIVFFFVKAGTRGQANQKADIPRKKETIERML